MCKFCSLRNHFPIGHRENDSPILWYYDIRYYMLVMSPIQALFSEFPHTWSRYRKMEREKQQTNWNLKIQTIRYDI